MSACRSSSGSGSLPGGQDDSCGLSVRFALRQSRWTDAPINKGPKELLRVKWFAVDIVRPRGVSLEDESRATERRRGTGAGVGT